VKKGKEYEGIVNRIDFPNKGIIQIEEEKVSVKNTLTGQKVRFMINKSRKGKNEGRLLEVLEKSPLETEEPKCKQFGTCGGCTYQTLSYEAQLELKSNQVKLLIDKVCKDYVFEGIKGSPVQWGYRNKMEFSFGDERKDGPLALGLHKKGSFYDIVTASECKIVDTDYNQILTCVLEFFTELGTTFLKKLTHEGYLRHLLVRRAAKTGEILLCLVTSSQWEISNREEVGNDVGIGKDEGADYDGEIGNDEKAGNEAEIGKDEKADNEAEASNEEKVVKEEARQEEALQVLTNHLLDLKLNGKIVGILHTYNDSLADIVQSDRTNILFGQDFFYEELLGLRFKISTFSFFQTNSLGAEVLYNTARDYIGDTKDKLIFDLYSGTGTIAQLLAPIAKKVIGVEIVEEAVVAARENATLNGLGNCEFIAGDVLKVIDGIKEKPDIIVLDPPRDGIHPKALDKIIDFGVDRIVYISCKPTSLARDLEVFQEKGYKVEKVCVVDMFPATVHVETVVLLSQLKPNDRIEVDLDLDELDATSAEMKATYSEIKDYVLKEHGLKVSNIYISQVKRKCGIEVGENYNLAKSEDAKQPNCPEEKEKAIVDALKHFEMVS